MKTTSLGQEITRLRLECGFTLRRLAARLEISAAHLSDIEHNHRRPSEKLLRRIARELRPAGATYDNLEEYVTGVDPGTREWIASTPGVRKLLKTVKESGRDPLKLLPVLEKAIGPRPNSKGKNITRTRKAR
jgi:transcriptional regulator with XRE-family HTH domain